MKIEDDLRLMARSFYWNKLFNSSQKINGIYLFNNRDNFSGLQTLFLLWLETYNNLYTELAQQEWPNLDEKVIKDNIRTDAFLYYRSVQLEKKLKEIQSGIKQNSGNLKSARHNNNNKRVGPPLKTYNGPIPKGKKT